VYLGPRINAGDLPKFPQSPHAVEQSRPKNVLFVTQQIREAQELGVDNFIALHFSGRNQFFFWLGKRCSELGQTREQKKRMVESFYNKLQNKRGFSIVEAFAAARVKS